MKKILLPIFVLTATLAAGQSKGYETLKSRFKDQPDVHTFSFGGWLCRAALSLAVQDDEDDIEVRLLHKAMADIDHIRFITIPKDEFKAQGLSVNGFRSYLKKDSFEELASVRDKGEHVTFYHKTDGGRKDQYFVLIEEATEVVAIEMKGYIDPEIFNSDDARITLYGK
jgi:DNA-binding transcriptional regulator of glucitol operon